MSTYRKAVVNKIMTGCNQAVLTMCPNGALSIVLKSDSAWQLRYYSSGFIHPSRCLVVMAGGLDLYKAFMGKAFYTGPSTSSADAVLFTETAEKINQWEGVKQHFFSTYHHHPQYVTYSGPLYCPPGH